MPAPTSHPHLLTTLTGRAIGLGLGAAAGRVVGPSHPRPHLPRRRGLVRRRARAARAPAPAPLVPAGPPRAATTSRCSAMAASSWSLHPEPSRPRPATCSPCNHSSAPASPSLSCSTWRSTAPASILIQVAGTSAALLVAYSLGRWTTPGGALTCPPRNASTKRAGATDFAADRRSRKQMNHANPPNIRPYRNRRPRGRRRRLRPRAVAGQARDLRPRGPPRRHPPSPPRRDRRSRRRRPHPHLSRLRLR